MDMRPGYHLVLFITTACQVRVLSAAQLQGVGHERTTPEIIIGMTILGVFLVVVTIGVLYCRFCTKRKRMERKLKKSVDVIDNSEEKVVPVIQVRSISPISEKSKATQDGCDQNVTVTTVVQIEHVDSDGEGSRHNCGGDKEETTLSK